MEHKNYLSKSLKLAIACFWMVATAFTVTSCEKESLEDVTPLGSTSTNEMQGLQVNGAVIPGKYIVVFKDNADFNLSTSDTYEGRQNKMRAASQALLRGKGIAAEKIEHVYGSAIKGMAVGLTNAELQKLRQDSRVAYIEQDRVVQLAPPDGKGPKKNEPQEPQPETDPELPWGVVRVGGGVSSTGTVWVIDTGVDLDHHELNVHTTKNWSAFSTGPDATPNDFNGHGTHVAGTIAAKRGNGGVAGVAAGAIVVAVKVLDTNGSGSYSGVISGVDYVAKEGRSGDVANMSLGGPYSEALNNAVINASGVVKFSIAAGNDGRDASSFSPASANAPNIYTISATDSNDQMARWSNYGKPPVDYAAPGVSITSTWKDGGYRTISGTSMAAPHVAGLLLLGSVQKSGTTVDRKGVVYDIAHK